MRHFIVNIRCFLVPSRRGDLEILGYNLIHWLGGDLPWEKIKKPVDVQASKEKYMSDLGSFLKTSFQNKKVNGITFIITHKCFRMFIENLFQML